MSLSVITSICVGAIIGAPIGRWLAIRKNLKELERESRENKPLKTSLELKFDPKSEPKPLSFDEKTALYIKEHYIGLNDDLIEKVCDEFLHQYDKSEPNQKSSELREKQQAILIVLLKKLIINQDKLTQIPTESFIGRSVVFYTDKNAPLRLDANISFLTYKFSIYKTSDNENKDNVFLFSFDSQYLTAAIKNKLAENSLTKELKRLNDVLNVLEQTKDEK